MAFSPGYVATVSVGGVDISLFTNNCKFNAARKDYQLPTLGGGAVRRMVGPVATMVDMDGWLAPEVQAVFVPRMQDATPVADQLVNKPQGAAGGTRSASCFVVDYTEDEKSEGPATWTAKLVVDGLVAYS